MTGPVMVNGEPNPTGTGRYCPPRVCYCGSCAWWKPIPPVDYSRFAAQAKADERQRKSWENRDESTWIDGL